MTLKMHLSSLFENPNCLLNRRNRYQFLVTLLGKECTSIPKDESPQELSDIQ